MLNSMKKYLGPLILSTFTLSVAQIPFCKMGIIWPYQDFVKVNKRVNNQENYDCKAIDTMSILGSLD